MSHIDYALKIRNEKSVIAYRNYLKEIEVAFNNSQWDKLKTFEEETKGLVKDIYKDKKIFEYSISMNLLALPSIGISTGNLSIKRKIHFSFLRKLGRFACKERKMID